jgi:predicted Zn-dependent protease
MGIAELSPLVKSDFLLRDEGSIALLTPCSEAAREWVDENIGQDNGFQPYFPTVVVEHSYIADIVEGIQNDGLAVSA